MNDDELSTIVNNLSDMLIIESESAVAGRDNEMYLQHRLLTKTCSEVLAYCLLIFGNNHIDELSEIIFSEILENAKRMLNENEENENDS
jgi:hypothetical protein